MRKGLNLGCGFKYIKSDEAMEWVNIDRSKNVAADVYMDIDGALFLPFEDNSFDFIFASHILEHIHEIILLMNECYRILKPGGRMQIVVPVNDGWFADPTHVRFFNMKSFRYYCGYPGSKEWYNITANFKQLKCEFVPNEDGGQLEVILEK